MPQHRTERITERYFYESFRDREASLTALYGELVADLRARTVAAIDAAVRADADDAEIARRGLAAFVGYLTDDPRRARVVLVEVVGVSPALEDRRHGVLREFADLIALVWLARAGRETPTEEQRLSTVGLVGAVNHLLVDWLMGGRAQSPSVLVDVCTALFTATRQTLWAHRGVEGGRGRVL